MHKKSTPDQMKKQEHMINELRRQSQELGIMKRLYAFLSEINQTIVRVTLAAGVGVHENHIHHRF